MAEKPIDDRGLARIHAVSNDIKFTAYLTGFFEGILSSKKLEDGEIGPLLQQCAEFADKFGCPDSYDIIEDFKADILAFDVIEDLVAERRKHLDLNDHKTRMNRFLGVCAGIACDDRFNIHEAERLLSELDGAEDLVANPHIQALQAICADAASDGVVDEAEAADISSAIAMIVGDCYADTGISALDSVPALRAEDRITSASELAHCNFVLTGDFSVRPRRLIEEALMRAGATVSRTVTNKVTHVIVAGSPSKNWLYTHGGTKLSRAFALQAESGKPCLVSEANIMRFLRISD